MKKRRKIILIILSVMITGGLFNKQIVWFCSRTLIEFDYYDNLSPPVLNQASINLINSEIKATDYNAIINESTKFVCKHLTYDRFISELNPNKVLKNGSSNCQGYHALFATTCNYLFKKHNITAKAEVVQGHVHFKTGCLNNIVKISNHVSCYVTYDNKTKRIDMNEYDWWDSMKYFNQ
jgi:hypothetical protein